jgi:hypothetical protein
MIPGYFAPPLYVTQHIHLGLFRETILDNPIITGFGGLHEPPYLFNKINSRAVILSSNASFGTSLSQDTFVNVRRNSDKTPIKRMGFEYKMRVSPAELDILMALYKREVWLIDNRHCKDDENHLPYLKIYYFEDLNYEETLVNNLEHEVWTVRLLEHPVLTHNQIEGLFI